MMHIPDGLMAPALAGLGWLLAIIFIAISVRRLNRRLDDSQITLMAVLAAGIFVAQMLNFPIGGGTTGHLVGAALAAMMLGPVAAMMIVTVILIIQALVFGDGGITAFGLNVLNMAIIGSLAGWYVGNAFPEKYRTAGYFTAAWSAVFLGALAASAELALSYSISGGAYGIAGFIAFPAMLSSHALIGIGEGIITTGVMLYLAHVSPDMLNLPKISFLGPGKEVVPDA